MFGLGKHNKSKLYNLRSVCKSAESGTACAKISYDQK